MWQLGNNELPCLLQKAGARAYVNNETKSP